MSFKEKLKNKKSNIFIVITIVILIIIGIYAFNKYSHNNVDNAEAESYIETYIIPESEKVFINGIVIPKDSEDFSLSADEELVEIKVKNGQSIKKGTILYTCKNQSIIDEISELKLQLSHLKSSQDYDDPSISLEINKLNSQIKSLNEKAYTKIYAPFEGKVFLNQNSEESSSLMTVQTNEFYMQGKASEQDLAKIKIDQTAKILVFSTNQELMGRISFISERPTSDSSDEYQQQSSLSYYDINITFDSQEGLINGFHVQASIKLDNTYTKIPLSSILKSEDTSYVFKDLDGVLKKQVIEIDSQTEEFAVVKSGLKENDIIIKNPTKEMQEGQSISNYGNINNSESNINDNNLEGEI